jgi:hypothetical protein
VASVTLALLTTSCLTPVGITGRTSIPEDAVQQCDRLCRKVGWRVTSLVVVANETGCVCGPRDAQSSVGATEATAGAVTVMLQANAEQQQRHQQRSR